MKELSGPAKELLHFTVLHREQILDPETSIDISVVLVAIFAIVRARNDSLTQAKAASALSNRKSRNATLQFRW